MMPRDVSTRWNSTFDMVDFAIDYQPAIDTITGNRDMKMRSLELDAAEWAIAKELRDTLKACIRIFHLSSSFHLIFSSDIQARHPFLFAQYPEYQHRHSCDGSHRRTPRHIR
jgi:hypothetical protein